MEPSVYYNGTAAFIETPPPPYTNSPTRTVPFKQTPPNYQPEFGQRPGPTPNNNMAAAAALGAPVIGGIFDTITTGMKIDAQTEMNDKNLANSKSIADASNSTQKEITSANNATQKDIASGKNATTIAISDAANTTQKDISAAHNSTLLDLNKNTNATQKEIAAGNNQTTMSVANTNAETARYQTDKTYDLGSRSLAFQQEMWQRDWQAADQLGLYSPMQLAGLQGGSDPTRMYQAGYRSLMSVPRSKHRNIYTL